MTTSAGGRLEYLGGGGVGGCSLHCAGEENRKMEISLDMQQQCIILPFNCHFHCCHLYVSFLDDTFFFRFLDFEKPLLGFLLFD